MEYAPVTIWGQVWKQHHLGHGDLAGFDIVYLTLAYGTNRVMLGEWADGLEQDSLLEVTGTLDFINDSGEFTIHGPYDFSAPGGYAPPSWRQIGIHELIERISPGAIPGVNDQGWHRLGDIPVMNMQCPVCRVAPGEECDPVGYLVSEIPGEPNCHQARWDRASSAEALAQDSDAVAHLLAGRD